MLIANPFVVLSDFRFTGTSKYPHAGSKMQLGAGQLVSLAGWLSPVEANFAETPAGRNTRRSRPVSSFYVARQNLINEKVWHWEDGNWNLVSKSTEKADDPDPIVVTFQESPAEISFYDSPGFMPFHFMKLSDGVARVCAMQNFALWINVHPRFSKGSFPASSHVTWYNLLCLEKTDSGWSVVKSESMVGRGRGDMDRPLWK